MKKKESISKTTTPKVLSGVKQPSSLNPSLKDILKKKKQPLSSESYVEGIQKGDKVVLSKAITLIESTRQEDQEIARKIIDACLPFANQSLRIGITGTPGVGKSSFIEVFGEHLISKNKRVAVLAVDPSSQVSGGSILGDKTRMEKLAAHSSAFIRPSPSGVSLGGVARKTREAMMLCEAAGYDTILVETVGVGQSETLVHSMVDFFLLLLLPGAGDELQGIKRGIVEMADLIAINKADGERVSLAKKTKIDYKNALHLFPKKESQWTPKVLTCSAINKEGIEQIEAQIMEFISLVKNNHFFEKNRKRQLKHWLLASIQQGLQDAFYSNEKVKKVIETVEEKVLNNELSPFQGAEQLLHIFKK